MKRAYTYGDSHPASKRRRMVYVTAPLVPWAELPLELWTEFCLRLVLQGYCLRTLIALRRTCKFIHEHVIGPVPNPDDKDGIYWDETGFHDRPYFPLRQLKFDSPHSDPLFGPRQRTTRWHRLYKAECMAMIQDANLTLLAWPLNFEPHGAPLYTELSDDVTVSLFVPSADMGIDVICAMRRAWPVDGAGIQLEFDEQFWKDGMLCDDDDPFVYRTYHRKCDCRAFKLAFELRRKKCFKYICHAPLNGHDLPMGQLNAFMGELVVEATMAGDPSWLLYFFFGVVCRRYNGFYQRLLHMQSMYACVRKILEYPPTYLRDYILAQRHGRAHYTWEGTIFPLIVQAVKSIDARLPDTPPPPPPHPV